MLRKTGIYDKVSLIRFNRIESIGFKWHKLASRASKCKNTLSVLNIIQLMCPIMKSMTFIVFLLSFSKLRFQHVEQHLICSNLSKK